MAKKNCKFSIVYKGRKIEFNSDKELDSFLQTNEQELLALAKVNVKSLNKIFSADPREVTKAILEEISIDVTNAQIEIVRDNIDPSDEEKIYKIPNSKGISNLIRDLQWVTPFNQDLWEKNKVTEYISNGLTETESKQKVKDEISSWKYLTDIGSEIHNFIDSVLQNKSFTPVFLIDAHMENLRGQIIRFADFIKKDLNDDELTIYSEFAIKSKALSPDKETILGQDGITSINGRLDFVVVDKYGKLHIYDWKVSPRKVGTWGETSNKVIRKDEERLGYKLYPSSKKETINYQMGAYAALFKQYGLSVESVNVVPVTLQIDREADGFTVKNVNNITIEAPVRINDFSMRGRVGDKISEWIRTEENSKQVSASLVSTSELLSTLFPKHSYSFQIQQFEADVEYYKNKPRFVQVIDKSDEKSKKYRYKFWTDGLSNPKMVYCVDEADRDTKLQEYVGHLKEAKSSELINLGKNIALAIKGKLTLDEIGQSMDAGQASRLSSNLKKYINGQWEFISDENLTNAGFFIFKQNEKYEIVMMTNVPLFTEHFLGKSYTLLGQFLSTRDRDARRHLSSSNSHMEAIKAVAYIHNNVDQFKDGKIAGIKVINPWHGNGESLINAELLDNWGQLMDFHKMRNNLGSHLFVDDVTQALQLAEDVIISENVDIEGLEFVSDAIDRENRIEIIEQFISNFVRKHNKLSDWDRRDAQDPVWKAYNHLLAAQNALYGYKTHVEQDIGDWTNGGIFNLTGLRVSSIQTSPSANMRELGELMNDYSGEVAQEYNNLTLPVRVALDAFYKKSGNLKAIGGEASYFLSWFSDLDNLILKNPDHPDFNAQPEARKALRLILETFGKLRWKTETEIEIAKENGKYYELPLMEAKFIRMSKRLGVKKTWEHVKTSFKNVHEGVFGTKEDVDLKQKWERTERSVYNRFAKQIDSRIRDKYIQDMTAGFFETDVERVFREATMSYVKEQKSRKYVPRIMGMKLALENQEENDGIKIKKIRSAFDDYVQKKFYGNPIVDEKLLPLFKYLSFVKAGFSKLNLGLNLRSFAREGLQGTWTGLSRSLVERIPGLDFKHYTEAYNWVVQHAKDNVEVAGLARQLGATYRMANMSLNEMPNQARVNWLGVKNWGSDTLFLTSTSPDFLHRTIILVAKMMADGSLDAHTVNKETNQLEYDWKKDKRFEIYHANDESNPKFLYQKTLYLKLLEEWNSKGHNLKEDDALPMAYTIREARTMRNWGNFLYGHYDTEVRALINDSFLGSMFMQYRTFVTAKLEQWLISSGSYNMDRLELQYDEMSGEELWEVAIYPNVDGTGMPSRKIIKKSEITKEEMDGGYARPYYAWQGDPLEGMAHGMWRFVKAFGTMNQEKLNELWKDPFERKNLLTGLNDLLVMMMLAMVIKALFGKETVDDIKNQSWITQWGYAVTLGSTQDGPIHQVLFGMFSDLNPPLVGSVKRIVNTSWSVINGDDRIGWAITQNVGAIREFQGMAKGVE